MRFIDDWVGREVVDLWRDGYGPGSVVTLPQVECSVVIYANEMRE